MDSNFDHQMSPSKSKCWYSNNCLHFLKCAVPLKSVLIISEYFMNYDQPKKLKIKNTRAKLFTCIFTFFVSTNELENEPNLKFIINNRSFIVKKYFRWLLLKYSVSLLTSQSLTNFNVPRKLKIESARQNYLLVSLLHCFNKGIENEPNLSLLFN